MASRENRSKNLKDFLVKSLGAIISTIMATVLGIFYLRPSIINGFSNIVYALISVYVLSLIFSVSATGFVVFINKVVATREDELDKESRATLVKALDSVYMSASKGTAAKIYYTAFLSIVISFLAFSLNLWFLAIIELVSEYLNIVIFQRGKEYASRQNN